MPDRYEVLAQLIDANADRFGDKDGWHHLLVGVLRDLHDAEGGEIPLAQLPDAIYDRIASGVVPEDGLFDRPLKPGEVDRVSGRYNPNEE